MGLLKRAWLWFDDRSGVSKAIGPVATHAVPRGSAWSWALGSATLFAFLVQVVTGIGLATAYVTSTADAYQSLQFISHEATFGHLIRGMHYWGASAMVLFIGLHMAQVFLIAAYKFPRELNWLSGVALLGVTLAMGFTGQLLRWDQTAVWSVIVAAAQAGRAPVVGQALVHFILAGDTVGGATLTRFFAYHVFFVPALIFGLVGLHLFLVLHHGVSEPPKAGRPVDPKTYRRWYHDYLKTEGVPFWPDSAWRDVVVGVGMLVVLVGLAAVVGAPELGKPPDPTLLDAYPRPDWYLLWYFAVLALLPTNLEDYLILLLPAIAGALLVALPFISNRGERSALRRPWAMGIVLIVIVMISTLWIKGDQAPWSPAFTAQALPPAVIQNQASALASEVVVTGAGLFHSKGCENCHMVAGYGGQRGPNLTAVGQRLSQAQMTTRILNGGNNMPAYGGSLTPDQLNALVAFLSSRRPPAVTQPGVASGGSQ
ncbi:MAG: cytochrome b N-terminal domain-containing protein [Herpetosiphonaceae bacterium]|nr:cytochrome b N-terminal domain-containing protein [Herpetosiphonaceae bacterium]